MRGYTLQPPSRLSRPLLAVLFAASGCAALIYQVVWFQLLGLVIGASWVSLGVLLTTFLAGMCLGSLVLPRFISPRHHPLRVFAFLELGIGVIGVAILYAMPTIGGLYAEWSGPGASGIVLRALVAGACLLPPTILMGATLPAVARWVRTTPRGVVDLGFFYGANIGGAVVGTLLAGFYLLRVYDLTIATFAAAALNAAVACASWGLARVSRYAVAGAGAAVEKPAFSAASRPIYVVAGLSGMTALSAEVLWTRHLSLLLGGTVYTFAVILAVFLLGLGVGSSIGSVLSRRGAPRHALGSCQLLLCAATAWAAYAIARSLPYWPLDVTLPSTPWVMLQLDLLRAAWAILPAALLWGASFPLALAAVAARSPGQDPARLVGGLYAANTAGAIAGTLATSFVLVPWLGSQVAQQALIVVCAGSAVLALAPLLSDRRQFRAAQAVPTVAVIASVAVLAYSVPELPRELVAYGRFMPTRGIGANVIYVGEGRTASIAVSEEPDGTRIFHSAGKAQASSYRQDMRLQRMLGHLTTLAADQPDSFLVIGLGAGVTAGAVSIDPAVERVVVAEIEPLVVEAAATYFREHNFGVTDNPRVELHIDDARHYLATTGETFDGITSDPLDPWVKGAAALYTREFWQLVASRLNPGGVVTVFLQLYESTEEAVRSEVATFFEVFPHGALFTNTMQGRGYDAVLLGRAGDAPIDVDRMHARLRSTAYEPVARSLREAGFHSAIELLATYAGRAVDLSDWLDGAAINGDRNLRLQYLAAQGLNLYRADVILDDMLSGGVEFPEDLFTGSPQLLEQLRQAIRARQGRF